jgi:RNA polymerase sigma-70 factor (ECF subfamily)
MSATNEPTLSPDLLLEHEPFVRSLARSLLRDEDRARDVVQETWLAALKSPPRSAAALKGWLSSVARNAARDSMRGEARRSEREAAAARPERLESTAAIHERLAVQRSVVDAVLRLPEPYRSPVLLRYYKGLTPDAIARRLDRKASTVRSQLTRSLELLRRDLDDLHEGDRRVWGAALAPLVQRELAGASTSLATKLVFATVGACVLIPVVTLATRTLVEPQSIVPALRPGTGLEAGSNLANAALQQPAGRRAPVQSPATGGTIQASVTRSSAVGGTPQEMVEHVVQAQRSLEAKLLTPDPRWANELGTLLELPGTGVTRLVSGDGYRGLTASSGGGSYFSFTDGTHQLSWEIRLRENGTFRAGGRVGFFIDLGEEPLAFVSEAPPAGLSSEALAAWEAALQPGINAKGVIPRDYDRQGRKLDRTAEAEVGRTWLLRSASPGSHNSLVALTTLERDETSCTIAWRILRKFGTRGQIMGRNYDIHWWVDAPPAWMQDMSIEELSRFIADTRTHARTMLFSIPAELDEEAQSTGSVARILHDSHYEPLTEDPYGGSHFSFATLGYDRHHDISLSSGFFDAANRSDNTGFLLDLGDVPLSQVPASASTPPTDMDPADVETWNFLWTTKAATRTHPHANRYEVDPEVRDLARRGANTSARARVGHTYLLRAIDTGHHDILVAFRSLQADEYGHTIGWRVLKSSTLEDEDGR